MRYDADTSMIRARQLCPSASHALTGSRLQYGRERSKGRSVTSTTHGPPRREPQHPQRHPQAPSSSPGPLRLVWEPLWLSICESMFVFSYSFPGLSIAPWQADRRGLVLQGLTRSDSLFLRPDRNSNRLPQAPESRAMPRAARTVQGHPSLFCKISSQARPRSS